MKSVFILLLVAATAHANVWQRAIDRHGVPPDLGQRANFSLGGALKYLKFSRHTGR